MDEELKHLSVDELLCKVEHLQRQVETLGSQLASSQEASTTSDTEATWDRMYHSLFEFLPLTAFETDVDGIFTRVNENGLTKFGYKSEEVIHKMRFSDVICKDGTDRMERGFNERRLGIKSNGNEYVACSKSGEKIDVLVYSDGIFLNGKFQGVQGVMIDMSERVAMEKERKLLAEQLRHARRVESVGRLAAGVAHDFNNLLSPIIGYSEVVIENLGTEHPLREDMKEILNSAHYAKEITSQLLAFGQRQQTSPEVLDLNALIKETANFARRLVPENIQIAYNLVDAQCWINGDRAQIKQILLNLFVNAIDAIRLNGDISVETAVESFQEDFPNLWKSIPKGKYVVLKVCDNGKGMDEEMQKRIFEPFFTTKESDGAGLGLSTVWGIAQHHDGYIIVDSKINKGTCICVYFPFGAVAVERVSRVSRVSPQANGLFVLVVDDDKRMCRLVRRLLTQQGYRVKTAVSVAEAREIVSHYDGVIDLLLTDIVLPELDGKRMATELCQVRPEMKVLYMSGYPHSALQDYQLDAASDLLQKPFDVETLVKKVKKVLH